MIGKEILNYTILSLIGKGGMGSVYLAEHKYIKQQKVAIKVINGNMTNEFTRQRLAEEADRLARLNHPNIVHFINYHIDEVGTVYLIMEYADGYSLEEYIKTVSGLIVENRVCSFFEPLLDAFEYAHKHKIIHKDIKPSNIVITKEGVPKILDFGIAALLDDRGQEEADDIIMGTPSYMSPEQVKGLPLDQKSDIYSLGVLLHQMLTGNPPYDTTTLTEHEICKHVVEEKLPRMKTYYKYVSDKVQAIVDKATDKNPENRYQSCADFKRALHNAIYPPKISTGVKVAITAAIVLILAGMFFVWDYNRVKIFYYKDYAEQWGIPQGIGELSSSEHKHAHRMYRFEYKNYKLQRMSHVNSRDIVIDDTESERYDRPSDVVFFYDDNGSLNRAKVMDYNGQVLYVKTYNEKLNTVIFRFDDEYGTEKTIGNETVGYVDPFSADQNRGKISRYLLEYDENGYVTTIRFAGFQNVRVCDTHGIYGKHYVRDPKGRVIEETYLAQDDSPKATNWGLGKKIFSYDENDNWIRTVYQTVDGNPSLDDSDGTAICDNVYDKYGNSVAQYFKNADGNLMLPKKHGVAGILNEYDNDGFLTKTTFIGIDGTVDYCPAEGYAYAEFENNEFGFTTKSSLFDPDGNKTTSVHGYAYITMVKDNKGNILELWHYDLEDNLVLNESNYAGVILEHDNLGHVTKQVCYGIDRKPCETTSGFAGMTREYDALGNITKETYLGTDLHPGKDNDGTSSVSIERDVRGNETKYSYYDENGDLTLGNNGIAVIEYKYDDNGNETMRQFLDTEGKLTCGYVGYAKFTQSYDENGHLVEERYYNTKDVLVLVDGEAGNNYVRDARGNILEEVPIGTDKKLAKGKLISRYKYDNNDNIIEFAVFKADYKPATNSDKYHKWTGVYNSRNQVTEKRYYGIDGNLTQYNNYGYCIERWEYDDRGNAIKTSFFDEKEMLTSYTNDNNHYAFSVNEYDQFGRVVRQLYFNKDGNPTKPENMVPEGLCSYDKWGNMTYIASCDGNGNRIVNKKTGWSYFTSEYDYRGNILWKAFFDEKEKPMLCPEGFHKSVVTYTKSGKEESVAYYDTSEKPTLVNGYHKELYKYNESDLCCEIAFFGKTGSPVNNSWGYHKVTFSYNDDRSPKERKFYNSSGTLLFHQRYVNGDWVDVDTTKYSSHWQKDVSDMAALLPLDLGEDFDNIVFQSVRVTGSSSIEIIMSTPKSKYDMSNSMMEKYRQFLSLFVEEFKPNFNIPNHVSIRAILKDSKGRELATITR